MNVMMIMKWMMSNNERVDRLLRPLKTLDGRDVIELKESSYDECMWWMIMMNDNDEW